jgi:hypothetical protein
VKLGWPMAEDHVRVEVKAAVDVIQSFNKEDRGGTTHSESTVRTARFRYPAVLIVENSILCATAAYSPVPFEWLILRSTINPYFPVHPHATLNCEHLHLPASKHKLSRALHDVDLV